MKHNDKFLLVVGVTGRKHGENRYRQIWSWHLLFINRYSEILYVGVYHEGSGKRDEYKNGITVQCLTTKW